MGGKLKAYTEMMNEARAIATKRMVEDAEGLGADAVVCCATPPPPSCRAPPR